MDEIPHSDSDDQPSVAKGAVQISGKSAKYTVNSTDSASLPEPQHPDRAEDDEEDEYLEDEDFLNGKDLEKDTSLIPVSEISDDGEVQEYEVALKYLGFGFFHIILLVINGIALSSDAVEVLSISFVFPVLKDRSDWQVGDDKEALLASIIFVGMLFGSFVWGGLADMIGRRTTIVTSLMVSVVFGFTSAFVPWFWMFVLFRFFSGFGVGGSLPVIFPYTSEFIRNKYRGPYLGVQSMFWMVGRFVCAALAWAIIPRETFLFVHDEVVSWRVFLAIAALPSLLGAIVYMFLPESPRFLLEVGREKSAMKALRLAYKLNHMHRCGDKQEYPVNKIVLDSIKSETVGSKLRDFNFKDAGLRIATIFQRFLDLFQRKYLRQTLLILVVMFCLSFGSYGIVLWYPTYVSEINHKNDQEKLDKLCNETVLSSAAEINSICNCKATVFEDAVIRDIELKEWQINDVLLNNITFINVTFNEVLFDSTTIRDCSFHNSTFTKLHFKAAFLDNLRLENVVIKPSSSCLFSNGSTGAFTMTNVSIGNTKLQEHGIMNASKLQNHLNNYTSRDCRGPNFIVQCNSDDFRLYRDSFLVSVSAFPGNVASAIAVYVMRRNIWLAISMFASTVSAFLLYINSSEVFVVIMLCIFSAVSTPSWNDTSLIIAELYPTSHRATAAGTHLLMARIGAILGTNIFGLFVYVAPSIPIIIVACLFFVGTIAALGLPKTTRKTLLK